jgi:hypothetical protein
MVLLGGVDLSFQWRIIGAMDILDTTIDDGSMSKSNETESKSKRGATPGLAILGCQVTGALGLIGGLIGLVTMNPMGAGVCLIPAALAFGAVAYVSFCD